MIEYCSGLMTPSAAQLFTLVTGDAQIKAAAVRDASNGTTIVVAINEKTEAAAVQIR